MEDVLEVPSRPPQPWLEERLVLSVSAGFVTEGQGCNHIGYDVDATGNAAVTIEIGA